MYCTKCGCRLKVGEKNCSDCGAEITEIEYNGGFWGLVGEKKTNISQSGDMEKPSLKPEGTESYEKPKENPEKKQLEDSCKELREELSAVKKHSMKIKGKYREQKRLLIGILVVLFAVCLVQTVRITRLSGKYKDIQKTFDILYHNYEKLNGEYSELNEKYEAIVNQLENSIVFQTEDNGDETANDEMDSNDIVDDSVTDTLENNDVLEIGEVDTTQNEEEGLGDEQKDE